MSNKVLFSYLNRHKQRIEYEVDQEDMYNAKIYLLEKSQTDNLGDIFIMQDGEWRKLDYYNE